MADKKLWFRRRTYGWGWTPVTWQGWLVLAVYCALMLILCLALLPKTNGDTGIVYWTAFGLLAISLTSFLIGVSYRTGESPHWQWGDKNNEKRDDG